ncbi:ATP-dependent DNA helicase RecG [Cytobacillus kochii]|uniref:ATP-dependent DNA helicase RecG n=1 Tax=Cytobacillus kochii TaxID=859143 RepID=UPI001CD5A58C|nr:ATP-dependent DNA helicase RecG [Cytobacillus kochii]MCA1028432.1 ATP-dependent DNA helicase RecG [Cytobacillus kochii]MCM3321746.1 ATP-dependent DNA helicase RecG [Cytobacillus kochii]MCM3343420.1 ATP-dependent DNA helicase RecG [Cytobacillus kochii]MDM5207251.1 ATP-dependent DNA helicase RecG [Cytobacillus kochii]
MLSDKVDHIKGLGQSAADNLKDMGITTVGDLIEYLPFRYEDYRLKDLSEIKHEERITVEGKVHSQPALSFYGRKRSRLTIRVLVDRYLIQVIAFNQPYLKKQIELNDTVTITGKWDQHRQTITLGKLSKGEVTQTNAFEPVYAVKGKVTVKSLRRYIKHALDQFGHDIVETLPSEYIEAYRLMAREKAIRTLHYPDTPEMLKQARRRLVYEEFFYFQLKIQALRKIERESSAGVNIDYDLQRLKSFIDTLPFELTGAQKRVVNEILYDMKSNYRMNRLLQGDVGSGKTAVAAIMLFAANSAGYQGALMVPTEILAEQHAESLAMMFANDPIRIERLTSSVKGKKRRELLAELEAGNIDIVIGTHALIQTEVVFKKLGLVITDEQHRFGVEQRRVLRQKGENPNVLFMTATPIPRTLAITAFGEMDVSIIDEMPAGRKVIETYWAKLDMLERVLGFMEKELRGGQQAYVICPLIEESEKLDVQNAIDVHTILMQYFQDRYKVGLMHGRLHPDEKEDVMKKFSDNQTQVLVSTTVVEVGVNVPNATMMLIYDADRFGLATLHQLRGRVGRGDKQSYCILLADPKSEVGKERMRIMTETNDGFVLSEKDLELRGPGDFFGRKQSGLPEFKVADMVHDYRALEVARNDATQLIQTDSFWYEKKYQMLRDYLRDNGVLEGEKLD